MQVTFDVFAGRPNPSWRLPPLVGGKVTELIGDLGLLRTLGSVPFPQRLGYRGLQLVLPSDIANRYRVTPWLNLSADTPSFDHLVLFEGLGSIALFVGEEFYKLICAIIDFLKNLFSSAPAKGPPPASGPCAFEMPPFDPGPWNDPAFIRTNNCYAYASNKRASYPEKPQPGVGSGRQYGAITGPEVAAAAKRDGAHDFTDCFPDSEAPRLLVALVIWPGQDYHWYRKHPDCWGHKPGSTPARNVDQSGTMITDPKTCDRGPYTEFTGFMLLPKSLKVAAP
jgi:hypothetical protein